MEGVARAEVVEPARAGGEIPAVFFPVGGVELKSIVQGRGQRGGFLFTLGLFAVCDGLVLRGGPRGVGGGFLRGEEPDGFTVAKGRGRGGASPRRGSNTWQIDDGIGQCGFDQAFGTA